MLFRDEPSFFYKKPDCYYSKNGQGGSAISKIIIKNGFIEYYNILKSLDRADFLFLIPSL